MREFFQYRFDFQLTGLANASALQQLTNFHVTLKPYAPAYEKAILKLRNKIGTFRNETKTRKAVFLTMITTFGLERNAHAASLVQNDITMDALFEG